MKFRFDPHWSKANPNAEEAQRILATSPLLLRALRHLVAAANCGYATTLMEREGMLDDARDAIFEATGERV